MNILIANYAGRVSTSGSAKLTIDKLKESDEGWVGCTVDLSGGKVIFNKVYLDVGSKGVVLTTYTINKEKT